MEERTSNVCYAIGKSHYGTAYYYRSSVLSRTLGEFKNQAPELEIFPRQRLAEITGLSLEEIRSMPDGTWYKIDENRLLGSGRLE